MCVVTTLLSVFGCVLARDWVNELFALVCVRSFVVGLLFSLLRELENFLAVMRARYPSLQVR